MGLPARCVGHDIHFTGFRGTDIIVLGKCSKPSYLSEIQIWLVSGYSRLIESRKENESLQHKSTRWRCEILGKWTTIASSKTWASSATNMWTCCPRQAWPQSSLTIKHYRVQVGNHQRGYQSPYIRVMVIFTFPFYILSFGKHILLERSWYIYIYPIGCKLAWIIIVDITQRWIRWEATQ